MWLRRYNGDLKIFGLYGGPAGHRRAAFSAFGRRFLGLDDLFISPRLGRWNWQNGDIALAMWFEAVGRDVDFDVLHLIEWDLLMLDSLDHVYSHVPQDSVGLTSVTPLTDVEGEWVWMASQAARDDWHRLLSHAREVWAYDADPVVCLAGGACLPRHFLELYSRDHVPELCHDELRLPLFAQAHGFRIVDTGFRRGWYDRSEDRVFNVGGAEVTKSAILGELLDGSGRRVFHPVRSVWRFPRDQRVVRPPSLRARFGSESYW
jgi:hypothetical protein